MADAAHRASLLLAPLQTPTLTFTKSQGHHRLPRLEQHTAGQGSGSLAGSRQPQMDSSAALQEGRGETTTNGEMFKVLLSIAVISHDPAKPRMLVGGSPSRKVSQDAAWSRWDGE